MDEQKQIIEILNNKKDSNITKQLELLKENQEKLKQYKSKKVLNEIQVPVEPYYLKVFNCINFKEIARICLKSVLNLQEFLLDGNSKTIDTDLNKVLKLTIQQKINS